MCGYTEWENAVVEEVAEALQVCHSDASGIVDGQPFFMQQSWGKGMDAKQTAGKILAEAQS